MLFVLSLLIEGSEYSNFYQQHLDAASYDSVYVWGLGIGILVSSFSAFAISYSTSWSMRVTSSTTYSMVGALNKLPIAVAGMIFFDEIITLGGVLSVFLGTILS